MKVKKIGDSDLNAGVKIRLFPGCFAISMVPKFLDQLGSGRFLGFWDDFSDFRTISRTFLVKDGLSQPENFFRKF